MMIGRVQFECGSPGGIDNGGFSKNTSVDLLNRSLRVRGID